MSADPPEGEPVLNPGASSQPRTAVPQLSSELLSRIWQQSLPVVRIRVERLQQAAQKAALGQLTAETRTEAADLAHKLAGSLGMFGLQGGTETAREIEQMLEVEGEIDPSRLQQLATRLLAMLAP